MSKNSMFQEVTDLIKRRQMIEDNKEWLEKRVSTIDQLKCVILVDKTKLFISLQVDETNFYGPSIQTKLNLSDEFTAFGINTSKTWEPHKLGDFIRMNRSFFESKETALNLVADLKGFRAKIEKVQEKMGDTRGNFDEKRSQAVETNLPASFNLKIPVFKGMEALTIPVEIDIEPSTLNCSLVSPDAAEYIQEQSNGIIGDEIEAIKEVAPGIPILYV